MVKIAICDDSKWALEQIKNITYDIAYKKGISIEITPFTRGEEIVDIICSNPDEYDVLLLDIDMPNVSGLEVARKIRLVKSDVLLIFISSHPQYVFEAIEYAPFRYIRKEKLEQEFPYALDAAFRVVEANQEIYITIKTENGEVHIKHSSIIYFECQNHKIYIYIENGKVYATRNSIKNFYAELCDEYFIKINSGCVVNAKYIRSFTSMSVTLDNEVQLIVSRSRIKEVKSTLLKYWGGKI